MTRCAAARAPSSPSRAAPINVSGAFDPQSAVTYTQSAGTLNVGVVGNNVSTFGTFELFSTSTAGAST